MRAFADLFATLDETTKTSSKVEALVHYLRSAPRADAAWAIYFLMGRRPRQVVPTKLLRSWAAELAQIPDWLFQESYDAVGDLAETITLLLPQPDRHVDLPLHLWVEEHLLTLRGETEDRLKDRVQFAWRSLPERERFLWNKLISGNFRVGVSQQLVTRAVGLAGGIDPEVVAHRLMGDWDPTPALVDRLMAPDVGDADESRPYPFFLATPTDDPSALGPLDAWLAEWKWDGIRAQLIRRGGSVYLWSRGEELVTERYPEIVEIGQALPVGTVIDGEILPWRAGQVAPFAQLQKRIGRKSLTRKILAEVPVVLMAFDLIEHGGRDVREEPLNWRRARLEEIVRPLGLDGRIVLSPRIEAAGWRALSEIRSESRSNGVEGLMIKRLDSPYQVGRTRGDWWKWKIDPYSIDAVLTTAQRGSGKRASLYTDYTFAVWDGGVLVPIAKAYSGLSDQEIRKVDAFIRANTLESFGPVRTVTPQLVFELAFEGIQASSRHKSGIAVRFPRIVRWRTDKGPEQADTLDSLRKLLPDSRLSET